MAVGSRRDLKSLSLPLDREIESAELPSFRIPAGFAVEALLALIRTEMRVDLGLINSCH
jgi:hypothetical protein